MQTMLDAWVEGVQPIVHDCGLDHLWLRAGLTPPCKRNGAVRQ